MMENLTIIKSGYNEYRIAGKAQTIGCELWQDNCTLRASHFNLLPVITRKYCPSGRPQYYLIYLPKPVLVAGHTRTCIENMKVLVFFNEEVDSQRSCNNKHYMVICLDNFVLISSIPYISERRPACTYMTRHLND